MTGNAKPAATGIAAGSRIRAHSWQAARTEYAPETPARQDARRTVTRITWAGRPYAVRYDLDDPDWRVRALARLDPLSDAAFAVRKVPPTPAEREAFAAWCEGEAWAQLCKRLLALRTELAP